VVYRRWGTLWLTVLAVALADWSATGIKALVGRDRPPVEYARPKALVPVPHDASFPSGHASTSFAAATVLTFAFPRLAPALFVLAAAIAFSRVYVGVHYPLDVLGGAMLGVLVATALRLLLISRQRLLRERRSG
jgi:undecaprenyl-diphosphatase